MGLAWLAFNLNRFFDSRHFPYSGSVIRADKALGGCLLTIQREGPKRERELRLLTKHCDVINVGAQIVVVSDRGWSVKIPSP